MVTLKDTIPYKRPVSLLALDYITAPASAVIATGTVSTRVQAWNDVISSPPRAQQGPLHGPSPPSKRHIRTRDGSDRGIRSSFGRRSEGSFAKPAGRSQRIDPEGIKRDGLPPIGPSPPYTTSQDAISGFGGDDIEQHRLAGIIREMTSAELLTDRRAKGRSLDSIDAFNPWAAVTSDHRVDEHRKRKLEKRRSMFDARTPDRDQKKSNHSSPKSVIEELGDMIDEALEHHRRNAMKDRATAQQIEASLEEYKRATSEHQARIDEIRRIQSREHSRQVLRTEGDYQERRDPSISRSSPKSHQQTPLIAKMAAERLALFEPATPIDARSQPASPPQRDRNTSRTLIRRRTKRRRASAVFRRPPVTNDYPMEEIRPQRRRSHTTDLVIPVIRPDAEEFSPVDESTTTSTPGQASTPSPWKSLKHSRRHSVAFRSSTFHDEPVEASTESEDILDLDQACDQTTRFEMSSDNAERRPQLDRATFSTTGQGSQQHSLTSLVDTEEQNNSTTEGQITVTESETDTATFPRPQSPKPSMSSQTSRATLTPKGWPFRWRLALVDKPGPRRSRSSAPSTPEYVGPIRWRNKHAGSGGDGADPEAQPVTLPNSCELSGGETDSFRRRAKRSQSDPQLSQSALAALEKEEIQEDATGAQEEPERQARSTAPTPKHGRSRSATVSRRFSHRGEVTQPGSPRRNQESVAITNASTSNAKSRRQSQATSRRSSDETLKARDALASQSGHLRSSRSLSDTAAAEEPSGSKSTKQSEVLVVERSGGRTPRPGVSRHSSTAHSNNAAAGEESDSKSKKQSNILVVERSGSRTPRPGVSRRSSALQSNNGVAEESVDSKSKRQPEMLVVESSGGRTPRQTLSRHSSRNERRGSTVDSYRTFRTSSHRGIRAITIKVEIRTGDEEGESVEQTRDDTVVINACLGSHREVSIDSQSGE